MLIYTNLLKSFNLQICYKASLVQIQIKIFFIIHFIWIYSNSLVFYIGAVFALLSLIATQLMPNNLNQFEKLKVYE